MSLSEIALRVSPAAVWGQDLPRTPRKVAVYDDTLLPYFLMQNNGEPRNCRDFLDSNRIGSVFDDLYPGREVKVTQVDGFGRFSSHPEA
jgi:hypothetical protein